MKQLSVDALIDVYRVLRSQQEALNRLMVGMDATVKTLMEFDPRLSASFGRHYQDAEQGPSGQSLAAMLQLIDETIRRLKGGGEKTS